jgi:hypothetical protein
VQNQYLVKVPTFKLKQLVFVAKGVHVQQTKTMILHVNIHITINYMSMVTVFQSNSQEGLIHIHSWVKNHLEVYPMEDCQGEDHLIETHMEDHHLIHMLDFTNGRHSIQGYSCHYGINKF